MSATTSPEEFYAVAKGYVQSAYSMMANPHRLQAADDITFFMAFHMLCGFAVELYLKAYLAHKGHDERQLRNAGHDLFKLHGLCVSEGLYNSGADRLVTLLGKHHKEHEFRYMKRATTYRTNDLCTVFSALSTIDAYVDKAIGASASMGLNGAGKWVFPSDGPWRLPLV